MNGCECLCSICQAHQVEACCRDFKSSEHPYTFTPKPVTTEPLSPSPEIRYLLHHWHHVLCHSYRPGGPCDCWEMKEKLIAELAKGSRRDG